MSGALAGFDDWLNRALSECAHEAGGDVNTYVARAVASQMVADKRRVDSAAAGELMARLAAIELLAEGELPDVSATIADPDRLRSLYATGLLDTPPDDHYDGITRAASDALDVPFAAVSLVDINRQFFKSTVGIAGLSGRERQTPLELSICQYAVAIGAPLVLEDARVDPVFKNHLVVQAGIVIAYLGIPLIDHHGYAIGTLCVYDSKPRLWSTGHVQILGDLAEIAAKRIFNSAGPAPP